MSHFKELQCEAMRLHALRDQALPCSAEWQELDRAILRIYSTQMMGVQYEPARGSMAPLPRLPWSD